MARRTAGREGGLPAAYTSFVGRRQEITELTRLLSEARLVTLIGGAGVGKTRLALAVASRLVRAFPGGVWLVELAGVADPALVEYTVAQTLHVPEDASAEPALLLARFLRHRQALLVLDNCEHLVPACAALAQRLLAEAEGLHILATSRHVLQVVGEQLCPVVPLAVDAPGGGHGPAVELFAQRAAAVAPGFTLDSDNAAFVAGVCQWLEGNPLAVELAAVRLRVLSPQQLAARLRDRFRLLSHEMHTRPARQRTLRAAVDWSHQLCTPAEQLIWARASVFAGGFDLDSAEEVCADDGIDPAHVLDLLDGLVSKSVLSFDPTGGGRYRLQDTLREYGAERLGDDPGIRRRHAGRYLRLAEQGEREWFGPAQARWLAWARDEHDNLRVALDFLLGAGDAGAALRLATALWFDWMAAARPLEGRLWLIRALARGGNPAARARALWASSLALTLVGDTAAGRDLADQAWQSMQPGDPVIAARIVGRQAGAAVHSRDFAHAEALAGDALDRFDAAGASEDPMAVIAHVTVAACRLAARDPDGAVAACHRAEAICQARQDRSLVVLVLVFLAHADWAAGNLSAAEDHGRRALLIAESGAARPYLVQAVDVLAWIAASHGDHERAAALLGASQTLWTRFGLHVLRDSPQFSVPRRDCASDSLTALGRATYDAAFDRGARRDLHETIALATGRAASGPDHRPTPARGGVLTPREREISGLVSQGLSNRAIAEKLVIARRTAESHVENVLTKLGFTSRSQIAAWVVSRPETDHVIDG